MDNSKKRDLTVAEYLCHMGAAVFCANVQAVREAQELLREDALSCQISIGDHKVSVDGTALVPEGWISLDEMEIECESAVTVSYDEEGNPKGLAMSMSQGLFKRGMHVKFRAKFCRRGTVEATEILRDTSNQALRDALKSVPVRMNVIKKEGE